MARSDMQRARRHAAALSEAELAEEQASELPDREAMSVINADFGPGIDNLAMPINEATALNLNSANSVAIADADQVAFIDQADTAEPADEPTASGDERPANARPSRR
jgi:hypothetical protein